MTLILTAVTGFFVVIGDEATVSLLCRKLQAPMGCVAAIICTSKKSDKICSISVVQTYDQPLPASESAWIVYKYLSCTCTWTVVW